MARSRRTLLIAAATAVLGLAIVAGFLAVTARPPRPLDTVAAWNAARNHGDVDEAMSYLSDTANLFGMGMQVPGAREQLRSILAAQAVAGWTVDEGDCTVDAETVTCRYVQRDRILDRWGLDLSGRHRYIVRDGRLAFAERVHDIDSQRTAYAVFEDFRAWVETAHADLVEVIWADPTSALYSTPEGAQAVLDVLDEYGPPGS